MKKITAYLLLLHLTLFIFAFVFDLDIDASDFEHADTVCTIYCENQGCTHSNRFLAGYGFVTAQVNWLYSLPVTYKVANLVIYVLGGSALLFVTLNYLFTPNRPRKTGRRRNRLSLIFWSFSALLLGLALMVYTLPTNTSRLFDGCVVFCLWVGRSMGWSLYETYTVLFAYVLPAGLLVLLVACIAAKLSRVIFESRRKLADGGVKHVA